MNKKLGDLPEDRESIIAYPLQKVERAPDAVQAPKNLEQDYITRYEKIRIQEHYYIDFFPDLVGDIYPVKKPDFYFHLVFFDFSIYQAVPGIVNIYLMAGNDYISGTIYDLTGGDYDSLRFNMPLNSLQPGQNLRLHCDCSVATRISGMIIGWEDYERFPSITPVRW